MSENSIVHTNKLETELDVFSNVLDSYLEVLQLPTENVVVQKNQRGRVIANLPSAISPLDEQKLNSSYYISKFVVACSVGLFDAALNFLWNEVIANLREKVSRFDLKYFYDTVITNPNRRAKFQNEDDLVDLPDWELIKGCQEIGIISELGFKHLDYIRDMRNWASAAHPNQSQLSGIQLVSWLETCITEVIAKEPEIPSLDAQRLLYNLRTSKLSRNDASAVESTIQQLPHRMVDSLLQTIFAMYTDPNLDINIRNNLQLIIVAVWDMSSEKARNQIGLKYAVFSDNADVDRRKLAGQYLETVRGLPYIRSDTRAVEMNIVISDLENAHYASNNYYNEPAHSRALSRFVDNSGQIPDSIRSEYVKVLTSCRLGNGFGTKDSDGVAREAKQDYDRLISLWQQKEIFEFVRILIDVELMSKFEHNKCCDNLRGLANFLLPKVTNVPLTQALKILVRSSDIDLRKLNKNKTYLDKINSIKV